MVHEVSFSGKGGDLHGGIKTYKVGLKNHRINIYTFSPNIL